MIRTKTMQSARLITAEIAALLLGLIFLAPFYFLLVNSFKSFKDILLNAASIPFEFMTTNYTTAWEAINFPKVAMNSFLITAASVLCLVILSSMTAYRLVRRPSKLNQFVFLLMISAMIIPFQSIMLQLVRITSTFGLRGEFYGIVACYIGFGMPLCMFLFHGFIKSVPLEIEEAAVVDGCSPYAVFWRIVFPLLKPIAVTVIILNSLWIWNDYLLPVLVIGGNDELKTIPLAIQGFFGQYMRKWDLAMAALTMSVAPVILFFLALQKYIVEGVTAGAIKG